MRSAIAVWLVVVSCGGNASGRGGGAGGTAGDGGGGNDVFANCQNFCTAISAANCQDSPSPAQCLDACGGWDRPACAAWNDLAMCAGPNPEIICVASSPYFVGCDEQFKSVQACSGIPDDAGVEGGGPACTSGTAASCTCPSGKKGTRYCLPDGHLGDCTGC